MVPSVSVLSGDRALGSAGTGLRLRRHLERLGLLHRRRALQILGLCAVTAFAMGLSSRWLSDRRGTAPEPRDWDAGLYTWLRPPRTPEPLTLADKALDFANEHLAKAAVPAGRALRGLHGAHAALFAPEDPEITLPGMKEKHREEEKTRASIGEVGRTIRMLEIG